MESSIETLRVTRRDDDRPALFHGRCGHRKGVQQGPRTAAPPWKRCDRRRCVAGHCLQVLNDRADVSAATRAWMQRLLVQYNYVPPGPPMVSQFCRGRRLIDLVFTALDSPYSVEILRGVTSSPMDVVVVDAGPFRLAAWSSGLASAGRSGAIIFASSLNPLDQHILDHAHVSVRVDRSGRQVARA
jgi:hypothetical protein